MLQPLRRRKRPLYYGWVIVGLVFLGEFAATGMGGLTIGLFYQPMHESLGWSLTTFTGAVTAASLAGIVIAPFLGRMLDRFGPRPIMLWGALAAGAGLLLLGRVQEPWQFWALYGMVAALGLHELGSFTGPVVVSKWFVRMRGRAMAFANSGTVVGGLVMTPVIGVLIDTVGWRQAWSYMGIGLLAVMVPAVWFLARRQPEDIGLRPDGDPSDSEPAAIEVKQRSRMAAVEESWTLREALQTRTLWLLVLSFNMASLVASVQVFHVAPFLTQQAGLSTGGAATIVTLNLLAMSTFRLPWGFVAERVPIRICLAIAFMSRAVGLVSLILVPFPAGAGIFIVLVGIGGSYGVLQPLALANYYGRSAQGTIQGAIRPFVAGPNLAGPLLVSMIFDATGTFDGAFVAVSVIGLFAGALVLLATPPVRRLGPPLLAPVG